MLVTLLEKERIMNLPLSQKHGMCWLIDWKSNEKLFSVERISGEWVAKSGSRMWFVDEEGHRIEETSFCPFHLYSVRTTEKESHQYIIVEPDLCFERYRICTMADIVIGRKKENDICLDSIAVSYVHARLSRKAEQWVILDENSANGVYVNNIRVRNACILQPGDVIYIMGFWMIMGKGFLAVSNLNRMITLNADKFVPFQKRRLHRITYKNITSMEYFIPDSNCADRNDSIEQCIDIIENEKTSMWSCGFGCPHFLKAGIGRDRNIRLPEYPAIGVKGRKEDIFFFCKGLLLKLITYYSYTDVKIVFLVEEEAAREFKTARWIPHVWDNQRRQSFFIRNLNEVDRFAAHIGKQYKKKIKSDTDKVPYYIVFGFHRELENRLVKQGVTEYENICRIMFSDSCEETFSFCNMVIELDEERGSINYAAENKKEEFVPDRIKDNIDLLYLQLANTQVNLGMEGNAYEKYYMVEVYVPAYGDSYDIIIPRNDRIGEIIPFILKQIIQREKNYKFLRNDAILCDREDGIILDEELTPEESGVLNGTRLMLI